MRILDLWSAQCNCHKLLITLNAGLNPATRFWPPSTTVVSSEPFSHGTGTLRCLQKEMATYRHWSVSLWRDPDEVSHCLILSPDKTEWRLILATLCRWTRCFVADQLWLMTCIQEEECWTLFTALDCIMLHTQETIFAVRFYNNNNNNNNNGFV